VSTTDTVVAEWSINRRDRVRVSIEEFRGVPLVGIRKYYEAADGEHRPSRQGISLKVEQLPALAKAIEQALATARERGLVLK
jgi:hypothetical protein